MCRCVTQLNDGKYLAGIFFDLFQLVITLEK